MSWGFSVEGTWAVRMLIFLLSVEVQAPGGLLRSPPPPLVALPILFSSSHAYPKKTEISCLSHIFFLSNSQMWRYGHKLPERQNRPNRSGQRQRVGKARRQTVVARGHAKGKGAPLDDLCQTFRAFLCLCFRPVCLTVLGGTKKLRSAWYASPFSFALWWMYQPSSPSSF